VGTIFHEDSELNNLTVYVYCKIFILCFPSVNVIESLTKNESEREVHDAADSECKVLLLSSQNQLTVAGEFVSPENAYPLTTTASQGVRAT
jgi:hypothetical protein